MASEPVIVGIDPGLNGGVAIWCGGEALPYPMPILESGIGKHVDGDRLADYLRCADIAFLERVHAMPGQGVSSMFRFGMVYGQVIGVLQTLRIDTVYVEPRTWKKVILPNGGTGKDAAKEFCKVRFPHASIIPKRARTPHDGMCDALCLMEYGKIYCRKTRNESA